MKIYEGLPDKGIIRAVNEIFYEKIYEHPWMSLYFQGVDQEFITQQQTDFIVAAVGGPNNFSGRLATNAHPHMFITDELFDLREEMLAEALKEAEAPDELSQAWLKIDEAFRRAIVKKSLSDCEGRFGTDKILNFDNPISAKKSA